MFFSLTDRDEWTWKKLKWKQFFWPAWQTDNFTWKTNGVHTKLCYTCVFSVLNRERESRMWNITKMMVPIHTKWICRKNDFLSKFLKVWRCSCRLMHNPFKKETMLIVSYFPFAHRYLTLKRIMHRSVRSFNIPLPRVTYRHSTSLYRETLVLYC